MGVVESSQFRNIIEVNMQKQQIYFFIAGFLVTIPMNAFAEIYSNTVSFTPTQGYSYNYGWSHSLVGMPNDCNVASASVEIRTKIWSWGYSPYQQDILASDTNSFNFTSGLVCTLNSATNPNPSSFYTITCSLKAGQLPWIANDHSINFMMVTYGGTYYLDHSTLRVDCVVPTNVNLSVTKDGPGMGVVTSSDNGINCGQDCSETYPQNTTVTLNAEADEFSYVREWGSPCAGAGECSFSISTNTILPISFGLLGDYDNNDDLDLADLILTLKILANYELPAFLTSDTDNDDKITLKDTLFILKRLSN